MPAPQFLEGKYDLVAKIREGGMGAVYKVRHRLLRELRVVKVMHPQIASSAEQRKRFVREAQTATRLKHPNIVAFYDFAVDPDGTAYMVMEYIDGTDLGDLVRRLGPIPVPIGLALMRQCLSALGYLHKRGIVHRDVSPDNILLSRDEDGALQAKLIDLGIAKVALEQENLTAADEFVGKLRYASPEQLTHSADGPIDGRSDLYSLGAAIYEVLTGVCPFRGKSLQSILAAHLTGSPVPFSESDPGELIPLGLRRALTRALETAPEERFQTAEEFLADIDTLPYRAKGEEVAEFLDRALGARQEQPSREETAVALPQPATGELETRTEAGPEPSLDATSRNQPAWGTGRTAPSVASNMPRTEVVRPESERTALYRPPVTEPADSGHRRLPPRLIYMGIALAAAVGLAFLWLGSARSPNASPAEVTGLPSPAAVGRAEPPATSSVPTEGSIPIEPDGSARDDRLTAVETVPFSPTAAPPSSPPPKHDPPTPISRPTIGRGPGTEMASGGIVVARPSPPREESLPSDPVTHYCAAWDETAYTQGSIKEKPVGFAADAAPAIRGPRMDAGRIHIDVLVRPERPAERAPFRVTARLVNDGDIDLVIDRIEESAERQEGGFRPVEGKGAVTVSVGSFAEIYRFEGALAGGATYRKTLRVVDRFGDSWRTSIRIVPCE